MISEQHNLLDYDRESLAAYLVTIGEQPFRAQQLFKWVYHHGVTDFSLMTNLSKSLRAKLAENHCIKLPEIITSQQSKDGTCKWLLQIADNNAIETVFIPEKDRGTLCISSQVGCPLDCQFCATAKQGFNRNLTTSEIISQVWLANKVLRGFEDNNRIITNIVFMGMGEPLLNYNNTLKTINILIDDLGFGLAQRRVTVSTSGIIPGITKLQKDSKVNLAISLHASNNKLRDEIIPINRHYSLDRLLAACKLFAQSRGGQPITIEYVMIRDVNDSMQDARALVKCLAGFPAKVNLIPFNKFSGTHYRCSDLTTIDAFKDILINAKIVTVVRKTRGDDIDAACGQLVGNVLPRVSQLKKAV